MKVTFLCPAQKVWMKENDDIECTKWKLLRTDTDQSFKYLQDPKNNYCQQSNHVEFVSGVLKALMK